MKIKTITCHEVYNHGASLQEHALLKYLEDLGHTAEAINYKPEYLSNHLKLWRVPNEKFKRSFILKWLYLIVKLPNRLIDLKRKKAFDEFSIKHIKTGNNKYTSNEELKNNIPIADAFICGSDQIWNSFFLNGKDPAFYLDFVPDEKLKISFAASFAIDKIDNDLKPFVKEKIKRIDHISVRETSGVEILKNLGIKNSTQVLDPVFLLDKNYWTKNFISPINEKYLLIYDFDNNPLIKKISQRLAKENNLKIYTVNNNITYADKNYWLYGPTKFLSLLANAQLIISNSFHAVAFSLIFEKQFLVVNRNVKINTRMRDLLELLDLSDIMITDVKKAECISMNPILTYDLINNKLLESIDRSKEFIKKALS
ncbi:hypothetical protein BFR04_08870 [Gaetbulibacter sp. 4G1]|nr:polysaccharide pyruvyl transferase family protein [Gaetbulibacter sp. 4G1]PIA77541.1 hypothetical protein BFR04_08870 [Gaetbulibacter sp. 4G1]